MNIPTVCFDERTKRGTIIPALLSNECISTSTCFILMQPKNFTSSQSHCPEMEAVFGEPPSNSDLNSRNNVPTAEEPHIVTPQTFEHVQGLTHITNTGEAQMVDVSMKNSSKRVAIAGCKVILGKKVFDLVSANQIAKGDVLSVARIAGITGAKQTSNIIPLCHNINLSHVRVDLRLNEKEYSVEIEGEAASTGKTGVEMEAMTAVTIAGLTVYDMCKAASKDIQIMDVRLEYKSGGKSGVWSRNKSVVE